MTTAVPAMAERMAAPDDGSFDHFAPENVSSVVTWLCSSSLAMSPVRSLKPRVDALPLPTGGEALKVLIKALVGAG